MTRTVLCFKLNRELPGLDAPPFPGELGMRIYQEISTEAFRLWSQHATILINHYGLHPADPETRGMLRREMEQFFFGDGSEPPTGWVAPDADRAESGARSKGGIARKK